MTRLLLILAALIIYGCIVGPLDYGGGEGYGGAKGETMYSYVDDAEAVAKCSGCGVLFDTVFNHKFNCKFCGTLVKTPKRYADDPDDPITLEIQKELDIPTFIRRQREARAAA